ncbi:MAG: putative membrane protein [Gammaproteobacteria bacterium]|jgi:uncharacterized membrane protein
MQDYKIMRRLDALAVHSESADYLVRRYFIEEHAAANELVQQWMQQAAMQTRVDAASAVRQCASRTRTATVHAPGG